MEKMIWIKPEMNEFAFAANEYVAACGDQNRKYLFNCDALAGALYVFGNWVSGIVFDRWNGFKVSTTDVPDFSDYDSREIGSNYHPCSKKHEADTTSDFYWGFVDYNKDGKYTASDNKDEDETVIVWRGDYGLNGHATKNLNMNTWETAKS